LFEDLINSVLDKNGHVDADDIKNVPFLLAIEGRRLNGYHIDVPNIIDDAPWASDLHWALGEARVATNTQRIAEIAIELYKRLQQEGETQGDKPTDKPEPPDDQEPPIGGYPCDDGEPTEGGDQPSDEQGEGDKPSDKPADKPSDKPSKGRGKSDFEGGRDPEPSDFIESEFGETGVESGGDVPNVGKPKFVTFNWR
jgi:hypothetical protein